MLKPLPPVETHPEAGVSLIEVMVVMAVIATMAAAAFAPLRSERFESPLSRSAEDLVAQLDRLSSTALMRGKPFVITPLADGRGLSVSLEDQSIALEDGVRLQIRQSEPFVISKLGIPRTLRPLELTLIGAGGQVEILFDGLTAREVTPDFETLAQGL